MKRLFVVTAIALGSASVALAHGQPGYQGTYVVKYGQVETLATSLFTDNNPLLRQQGIYSALLKQESGGPRGRDARRKRAPTSQWIRIKEGVVFGELNLLGLPDVAEQVTEETAPIVVKHTLTNDNRDGVITSASGQIVSLQPAGNNEDCPDSTLPSDLLPIPGIYVYDVQEVLSGFSGEGVFEGLDPNSVLVVEGQINFCSGKNDFKVVDGGLCFGEDCEPRIPR